MIVVSIVLGLVIFVMGILFGCKLESSYRDNLLETEPNKNQTQDGYGKTYYIKGRGLEGVQIKEEGQYEPIESWTWEQLFRKCPESRLTEAKNYDEILGTAQAIRELNAK